MYSTCVCVRAKISLIFLLNVLKARVLWIFFATPCARTHMGSLSACSFIFFQIQILFLEKQGNAKWGCVQSACLAFSFFFTPWLSVSCSSSKGFFFLFFIRELESSWERDCCAFCEGIQSTVNDPFLCSLPDTPCMRANVTCNIAFPHNCKKRWQ